jgi:hypothetical protein
MRASFLNEPFSHPPPPLPTIPSALLGLTSLKKNPKKETPSPYPPQKRKRKRKKEEGKGLGCLLGVATGF